MIPLALLLPLVWNYILIVSGRDTRQDVVSNPIPSLVSMQCRIKHMELFLETLNDISQLHENSNSSQIYINVIILIQPCVCCKKKGNLNANAQMNEKVGSR